MTILSDYQKYRLFEILPGLSIWLTLILAISFSFWRPLWMIYFIIVFDLYWVMRVIYFSFYLIMSWRRFRRSLKIDWFGKLRAEFPGWREKKNVIFLPLYNEEFSVVTVTLEALLSSTYPADKFIVVFSGEARNLAHWQALRPKIEEQYAGKFADLIFYTHPDGLPDEIRGKGSHLNWMEKEFRKYADQHGWKYIDIIVSAFDVDTVAHPQYFAHLNYMYCRHPRPDHSSFQPVTLYNNNLWESPSILRIMAFGTTFWTMFSLARLDNLVTFSSHSMSFQALVDCGGHAKNIVSEDSRIFYQCWLANKGDYEVTPLYIPVSMYTVRDEKIWTSLKNLYFQQRRWAWGTEHVPYLMWQWKKHPEISRWKKLTLIFREWEGKWSWAMVAIIITVIGRLPLWVAGDEIRQSALFFNTPHVLELMMSLAMLGLFLSAILSMLILPPLPAGHPKYRYLFMILQWILLPVSLVVFSAIPCIDAVTHLMLGKYLGFNVSAKKRAAV
jgi:cellulose synthase/poly-beta-1,6-N-acetylglucosamine synthase-like glycosyltransferase